MLNEWITGKKLVWTQISLWDKHITGLSKNTKKNKTFQIGKRQVLMIYIDFILKKSYSFRTTSLANKQKTLRSKYTWLNDERENSTDAQGLQNGITPATINR